MKHVCYSLFFVLVSLGTASAQKAGKYDGFHSKMGWIVGKWGIVSPEGSLTEIWTQKNDSTYAGETYFVMGKDTVFSEKISLEQRGNEINYITVIANQNQGKPTAFKLMKAGKKSVVFENPTHDYPQKITYTKITDGILAEISGKQNGKPASEKFPMGKLK